MNRWFAGTRASGGSNGGGEQGPPVKEADFIVLPPAASDSWRSWLVTGVRRGPFDRRRIKGAHKGLKRMLIEGTTSPGNGPQPWNDFSSAMVRQSVEEALNTLPSDQKRAVKLAYFGGLTNREIAQQLGVAEGSVRRRLREALAAVAAQVEPGRVAGRRAIYAIAGWLTARAVFSGAHRSSGPAVDQVLQAATAVTVGVVAAALLVSAPASPAQLSAPGGVPSAAPAGTSQHQPANPAIPVAPGSLPAVPGARNVPPLPANVRTPANVPVAVPTPPVLPITVPTPSPFPIAIATPTVPVTIPIPTPSLPGLP